MHLDVHHTCSIKTGIPLQVDNDNDNDPDDISKAAATIQYKNIKEEMKMKMEELSIGNLTMMPRKFWIEVRQWANEVYGGNRQGLKEHQFTKLARKRFRKLGLGNTIETIENTPEYKKMKNQDRAFLHWLICLPHPEVGKGNMRAMMFANPKLSGLLYGVVQIFVDTTFACTPISFY
jgi:hypothetical protein